MPCQKTTLGRSFDGIYALKALLLAFTHTAIIGGAGLDYFIKIDGKSDYEIRALLDCKSDIQTVLEKKACCDTLEEAPKKKNTLFAVITGHTQTMNKVRSSNKDIMMVVEILCHVHFGRDLESVIAGVVGGT